MLVERCKYGAHNYSYCGLNKNVSMIIELKEMLCCKWFNQITNVWDDCGLRVITTNGPFPDLIKTQQYKYFGDF